MNITEYFRSASRKKRADTTASVRFQFRVCRFARYTPYKLPSGECRHHPEYKYKPNDDRKYRDAYADADSDQRQIQALLCRHGLCVAVNKIENDADQRHKKAKDFQKCVCILVRNRRRYSVRRHIRRRVLRRHGIRRCILPYRCAAIRASSCLIRKNLLPAVCAIHKICPLKTDYI